MAIGTCRTGHTCALLVASTGLGTEFTHLLGELTAGEIRIGLAGDSGGTGGLLTGCFAVLRHGITTGKNKCTTWILDGATLGRCGAAFGAAAQLQRRSRAGGQLGFLSSTLATATTGLGLLSNRSGSRFGLLGHLGTVAILAGVGRFATAGQGFTSG